VQHRLGEVDADDARGGSLRDVDGDAGRSGCDVEDERRLRRDGGVDHRLAPSRVLSERQQPFEPVVAPGKTREQLLRETVRLGAGLCPHRLSLAHR
jgi:hypothetical protein